MAEEKTKRRRLPDGDTLSAGDGGAIVRSAPTSVVVVAGPAQCGKTTLVAGLYELFHRGPFGGFLFAGSRTLPGFERRCHLARIASGREAPDTERTVRSEGTDLLHLRLSAQDDSGIFGILFSDIYGEAFRRAADAAEECQQFTILKRADHVSVLVDGEKVANNRERQSAFSSADDLIGQCLDCGMFNTASSIQVVVTKWDLLLGNASAEQFVHEKLAWLNSRYASKLGELTSHKLSIRPTKEGIDAGYGMAELLKKWTRVRWPIPTTPAKPVRRYLTEFDRSELTFSVSQSGGSNGG